MDYLISDDPFKHFDYMRCHSVTHYLSVIGIFSSDHIDVLKTTDLAIN